MSFCVRSFTSGTKYVPSFVASAQGCVVRQFNSRQLAKHVNPQATSPFLNEFLGSSVPVAHLDINDDCKVSNETGEITNNAHQRLNSYCDLNQLDNEHYFNNEEPIKKISTHNERYDPFSHEVICVPFLNSAKERLVFSDNLVPFEDQVQIIRSENSCGNLSNVTSFKVLEALSKDESKVFFAAKNASAIKEKTVESTSSSKQSTDSEKKPSSDDLEQAFNTLSLDLPKIFVKTMDYSIYHQDVVFVNNIKGSVVKGIYPYVKYMSFLRLFGHIKYAYVKLEILKITMHTQDNTIRVRWRINGITNLRILFTFWRFKFWKIKEALKECEVWVDGYSTFYLGNDGLIYKHVADKMMPDDHHSEDKPKTSISAKLASQLNPAACSSVN